MEVPILDEAWRLLSERSTVQLLYAIVRDFVLRMAIVAYKDAVKAEKVSIVKRYATGILLLILVMIGSASAAVAQDAQPGAAGLGDSLYPEFGNGGYDTLHYTLDLTVDPETQSLDGITTIRAMATQDLSSFNLDLIGFTVESVQVDGADAEFSREGQELYCR